MVNTGTIDQFCPNSPLHISSKLLQNSPSFEIINGKLTAEISCTQYGVSPQIDPKNTNKKIAYTILGVLMAVVLRNEVEWNVGFGR